MRMTVSGWRARRARDTATEPMSPCPRISHGRTRRRICGGPVGHLRFEGRDETAEVRGSCPIGRWSTSGEPGGYPPGTIIGDLNDLGRLRVARSELASRGVGGDCRQSGGRGKPAAGGVRTAPTSAGPRSTPVLSNRPASFGSGRAPARSCAAGSPAADAPPANRRARGRRMGRRRPDGAARAHRGGPGRSPGARLSKPLRPRRRGVGWPPPHADLGGDRRRCGICPAGQGPGGRPWRAGRIQGA